MQITSTFDSGNIICRDASDPSNVELEIRVDNDAEFYQWFYFRVTGAAGEECSFRIVNAGGAAYTEGWADYCAVASYDRQNWFRVDTEFDGEVLSIHHMPEVGSVYYAYFAPYTVERHADLIAHMQLSPIVQHEMLGKTLDGQDLDLLKIGFDDEDKKICWIIARQHPGETMAEWWMEGFLHRLSDPDDPVARELLERAVFYVVPNMNPDGSKRGHLRTNAVGSNLNREWMDASLEKSPEVFYVREMMAQTGVDFCLDVHGDEALPYNFIAGAEGVPGWTDRLDALQDRFCTELVGLNPDFQTGEGYDVDAPGEGNLTMCTNYVAQTHDCLAMTLEMPFKDTVETPNDITGWSPERSRKLGEACLGALYRVVDDLRD